MKKVFYLFFTSLYITFLTSCSSDVDDTFKVKLLQKVIEVHEDKSTSVIDFSYDGNKIQTIETEKTIKTFTYTGNLITKIVEFEKSSQQKKTFDYVYIGDLLSKVISSDKYTLNYTHQPNGTVDYQKTTMDNKNEIVFLEHGTLYFQNQNLIKFEKTLDTTGANILTKKTLEFAFDQKVNPLKNIIGFIKLLDYCSVFSLNNNTSRSDINSITYIETEQITSSIVYTAKLFNYDQDGYPKELISDETLFGIEKQNLVKSQYFY